MNYIEPGGAESWSLAVAHPYTTLPVVLCECGALVHADMTPQHDAFHEGLK